MLSCWAILSFCCVAVSLAAEATAVKPLQTESAKQIQEKSGPWAKVLPWTHAWDVLDATTYEDDGHAWSLPAATRIDSVADRGANGGVNNRPLHRDNGRWGFNLGVQRIPGPKLIPCAPQFNGRPAWLTDFLRRGGFCGEVFAMLSPIADPRDNKTWFNAPKGYDPPYWGAVLCRPANVEHNFNAWDGFNGQVGTTVTLGKGLIDHYWGATTSVGLGDPWPTTKVKGSDRQTVLVIGKVDGKNSFMEFHQRDAHGKLMTERANFTLKSYPVKEMFFGYVHHSYVSVVGLKTRVAHRSGGCQGARLGGTMAGAYRREWPTDEAVASGAKRQRTCKISC